MKTLIELFDIRPIENVLGTEVFRPEETIVLFPPEAGSEKLLKKTRQPAGRVEGGKEAP